MQQIRASQSVCQSVSQHRGFSLVIIYCPTSQEHLKSHSLSSWIKITLVFYLFIFFTSIAALFVYFAELSLHLLPLHWFEWISGLGTPGVVYFIQDKTLVIGPVDRATKFKMAADRKAFLKECADLPLKHSSGAGQGLVMILLNMNCLRSIISRELSCWFSK